MFNVILTTYQRDEELLRLLRALLKVDWSLLRDDYKISIYDDFPDSKLKQKLYELLRKHPKVEYNRRTINFGQGENHMDAVRNIPEGQYIWMPGDDDIVDPQEFTRVLGAIKKLDPDVLLLEFRQGKYLEFGTFYETHLSIVNGVSEKIEAISRFGKCTSTVFKKPGESISSHIDENFKKCMYTDKAFALARALENSNSRIMCYNKLVAYGDANYSKLRYSMRAFSNLEKIAQLISAFLQVEIAERNFRGEARWWISGLFSTINPNTEIRYTGKRFLIELFWPLWRIFTKKSDFVK
jgi:glycosyltransferase involved in cell wall biosynthesis